MTKIAQKMLLAFLTFTTGNTFALDSGSQNLTTTVGATDYFKINCAGDTDHLNFKLVEGNAQAVSETNTMPSQLFNAKLTKLKLTAAVSEITAGTYKEITLKGGNGAYILALDTFGTNLSLKTAQTYSVQYQCLNAKEKMTTGSSTLVKQDIESTVKTLSNGKTAKYVINCARNKATGDTSSLKIKLINKTAISKSITSEIVPTVSVASGNLAAQVVKGATAKNTTGDAIDVQNGNGDYSVMVNSPTNKALSYHFQYSCLNTKNVEAKTSLFKLLQDQ